MNPLSLELRLIRRTSPVLLFGAAALACAGITSGGSESVTTEEPAPTVQDDDPGHRGSEGFGGSPLPTPAAMGGASPTLPETFSLNPPDRIVYGLVSSWMDFRSGGFDVFSTHGGALGYTVNELDGFILIVALQLTLPFYQGTFEPSPDISATASSYVVAPPVAPLLDDVERYPLLAAALTDHAGLWAMSHELTAILLAGDPKSPTPEAIYVAGEGSISLTREDGPFDEVTGSLTFARVSQLGGEQVTVSRPVIQVPGCHITWSTEEQP